MGFKTLLGVCALVGALGTVEAAAAPSVVTNPDWLVQPNSADIATHYPEPALTLLIEGRAVVSCDVDPYGALVGCKVDEERPLKLGFGDAALALTKKLRMKPKTVNGRGVVGGTVRIPIRFILPPEPKAPSPPNGGQAPAVARSLATRLMASLGGVEAFRREAASKTWASPGVAKETVEAARKALADRAPEAVRGMEEGMAHTLASVFSPLELAGLDAFLATPTGKAAAPKDLTLQRRVDEVIGAAGVEVLSRARETYCQARNCDLAPSVALLRELDAGPKPTIEAPRWSETPSPAQLWAAQPGGPKTLRIAGWSLLTCKVGDLGLLDDCAPRAEHPKDMGFSAASLSLTGHFRLAPEQMAQGAATETVAVWLIFPTAPLPESEPSPTPKSPASLEAARTLVAEAQADVIQIGRAALEQMITQVSASPEAAEAIRQAYQVWTPKLTERLAASYAAAYSEGELRELAAFRRSAAGRALATRQAAVMSAMSRATAAPGAELVRAAARDFCKDRGCAPS